MKERSQSFITKTLGDLYLEQGLKTKARRIYKQLLEKHPDDEELKEKIRQTYTYEHTDVALGMDSGNEEMRVSHGATLKLIREKRTILTDRDPSQATRPITLHSRENQERAERVINVLKAWLEKLNA